MGKKGSASIVLLLFAVFLATVVQLNWISLGAEREVPVVVELDNGMTVIVRENHAAPIVALDAWVGTGAIHEDDENNGVSHFFEHMLFKGTEKRGVGEFSREVASWGGRYNAATSQDFTHYYVVVSSRFFDEALDALSDILMNPAFDPEEIEKERLVILEEKRRSLDNPPQALFRILYELSFPGHPYHRTVLGTLESISRLKREDFLAYHRTFYAPNDIAFVVVGDVEADEVASQVGKAFQGFAPRRIPQERYPIETGLSGVRRKVVERDVKLAYLGIAFRTPGIQSEDVYALDVAAALLGKGRSSRLYRRIREEEQLVTSIEGFHIAQRDAGLLILRATLRAENLRRAEEEILTEIAKLREEEVPPEELEKAKTQLVTEYAFDTETNAHQASLLGYYQVVAGDYRGGLAYPDEIGKVTAADVRRVASIYFTEDLSIAVIKPRGDP
jgi:zinc protease